MANAIIRAGHGHHYVAEATVGGSYDEKSGTLFDFTALRDAIADGVSPGRIVISISRPKILKKLPLPGRTLSVRSGADWMARSSRNWFGCVFGKRGITDLRCAESNCFALRGSYISH